MPVLSIGKTGIPHTVRYSELAKTHCGDPDGVEVVVQDAWMAVRSRGVCKEETALSLIPSERFKPAREIAHPALSEWRQNQFRGRWLMLMSGRWLIPQPCDVGVNFILRYPKLNGSSVTAWCNGCWRTGCKRAQCGIWSTLPATTANA